MSETLNITELIRKLQDLLDAGLFEYTPTNVDEVRRDGPNSIEIVGATASRELEAMQRDIDALRSDLGAEEDANSDLRSDLKKAERAAEELEAQIERLREELADANERIELRDEKIEELKGELSDANERISELSSQ